MATDARRRAEKWARRARPQQGARAGDAVERGLPSGDDLKDWDFGGLARAVRKACPEAVAREAADGASLEATDPLDDSHGSSSRDEGIQAESAAE